MNAADVPPGPLAIDTDVFSLVHTRRGSFAEWETLIGSSRALSLPFPVVGELRAGYLKAGWGERRVKEIEHAIRACVVIPSDSRVVDQWARIYARFHGRLKGGGVNDMWITACCLVHGLPLASANRSDFQAIAAEFSLVLVHPEA